jgi:hypothetical protein
MTAVAAILELLVASDVVAICPATDIVAGVVAQGADLPAISIMHISTVPFAAMDAQAEFNLVTSRVQVTAMAKDYPTVKTLLGAVRMACNYRRGLLAGVQVVSVVRDTVGPDLADDDATIHFQSMDFKVTFHEPN